MTDTDRLEERLTAVERTVVDGDYELEELAEVGEIADDLDRLDSRFDDVEERLAELEATVQSMGGFVSNVESVNEGVEQQAAAAVAAVDRLERRLDGIEQSLAAADSSAPRDATAGSDGRREDRSSAEAASGDSDPDAADERDATDDGTIPTDDVDRAVDELVPEDDAPLDAQASSTDADPFERSSVASDGGRSRTIRTADQRTVAKTFSSGDGADGDGAPNESESTDESAGVLSRLRSKLP